VREYLRMPRPGTFTDYHFESMSTLDDIRMFVTWDVAPEAGAIYPAFNYSFEARQILGYMGIQLVGRKRTALFSIWDLPDQPDTAVPAVTTGFRAQCHLTCQASIDSSSLSASEGSEHTLHGNSSWNLRLPSWRSCRSEFSVRK
jgi:hypothetical protein